MVKENDKPAMGYFHCCAVCGRPVRTKVPKGGDGSELVPWKHNTEAGAPCDGDQYVAEPLEVPAPMPKPKKQYPKKRRKGTHLAQAPGNKQVSRADGKPDRTPQISIDKYNELYAAYHERQTINHLVKTCHVSQDTAKRYVEKGDPKRNLMPIKDRWQRTQQQAQMAEDYSLVKARREVQTVARAYLQRVAARISKLDPAELDANKVASQLQVTQSVLERTLGVADATVAIQAEDPFHGWSTEELMEFAASGTMPEHARGIDNLAAAATARRKSAEGE
jgi:hypothetical protein